MLTSIENSNNIHDNAASFIQNNSTLIIIILVVLVSLVIALSSFLIILYRQYHKDELILRKYKIDASNEDVSEIEKQDKLI